MWPLEEIRKGLIAAFDKLTIPVKYELSPLQEGDIQKLDTVPGGDGFVANLAGRAKNNEGYGATIKIKRDFKSPLIEQFAHQWDREGPVTVYVLILEKRGSSGGLGRISTYRELMQKMPKGLIYAR